MRTQLVTFAAALLIALAAVTSAGTAAAAGASGSSGGGGGGGGGGHGGGGGGGGSGGGHGGGGGGGRGGGRGGGFGGRGAYGSSVGYAVNGPHGGYGIVGYQSAGLASVPGEPGARGTLTLGPRVGSAASALRVTSRVAPAEQLSPRPGLPPRPTHVRTISTKSNCLGAACGFSRKAFCDPWVYQSGENNSWPVFCGFPTKRGPAAEAR